MTVRIGVVVNPRARYIKRHPAAIERLRRILGGRGELVTSRAVDEVDGIVARFKREGVDVVAIVGGDGTAGIMARGIVAVYGAAAAAPPLAMLRGGTMNTVANALRLPRGKPEEHLTRLLERTGSGVLPPVVWRPTLVANGRLGFLFGTGAFYTFLEQYYRAGHDNPSAVTAVETITRAAASVLTAPPPACSPAATSPAASSRRTSPPSSTTASPSARAHISRSPPGPWPRWDWASRRSRRPTVTPTPSSSSPSTAARWTSSPTCRGSGSAAACARSTATASSRARSSSPPGTASSTTWWTAISTPRTGR
ncbi:MAG: hypothetical protein CVU56_25290 [Deltaproteobacteria bacterium HGW-Deltaproteobacteria-14]|nr:MAG: hypothetical protein CVU56_25290 [Deltaproteobacteria bacterium HGW-Deltaproteobacteria-14]